MNQQPTHHPTYPPEPGNYLRLCANELWSFVRCKKAQHWLWQVEEATTGQVVAFVFGRRTHASFRRLLADLAQAEWRAEKWFTDAWGAYEACLLAAQRQTGKAPMQRLERKHLTYAPASNGSCAKPSVFPKSNSSTMA